MMFMHRSLDSRTRSRLSDIAIAGRLAAIKADARGLAKLPCRTAKPTVKVAALSMADMVAGAVRS